MTVYELALDHMQSSGMTEGEAEAALIAFSSGDGRNVPWENSAPYLPPGLLLRIDAVGTARMTRSSLAGASADDGFPPRAA